MELHHRHGRGGVCLRTERLSGTTPIARREAALATRADAERAQAATLEHLYRHYSVEGFSLIEHLLLRPRRDADTFLSLPEGETTRERDPYSQRISFVFPSGYARNFSDETVPAIPVTPDRFRDPEFRRHAERVIQQACPTHLRPTTYWVDQAAPGIPHRLRASTPGSSAISSGWIPCSFPARRRLVSMPVGRRWSRL